MGGASHRWLGALCYMPNKTVQNFMSTLTKLCKHCKSEINIEASKCPKCGGTNYVWTKNKKAVAGLIILGIFTWVIILSNLGSTSSNSVSTPAPQPSVSDRKYQSIAFAEHVIEGILKSPSTAKFVDVQAYELSNLKDVWAINGYVDSQNSYGAMLRNQWEVQLDYRDGKGGIVKSILFDGKKVQ